MRELKMPEKNGCVCGCLFGLAIGDSLGMPFVSMTKKEISLALGRHSVNKFFAPIQTEIGQLIHLSAGDTTDNWHFARAVAKSLISADGFDLAHCLRLHLLECEVGLSASSSRIKQELLPLYQINGDDEADYLKIVLRPAVEWYNNFGMGTIMTIKSIPLALYYHDRPKKLLEAIIQLSAVTNKNIEVALSAYIFGLLVGWLYKKPLGFSDARTQYRQTREIVNMLIAELAIYEKVYEIKNPSVLYQNLIVLNRLTYSHGLSDLDFISKLFQYPSYYQESIPLALAMFFRQPNDYYKLLSETIKLGGDTAGNASLVGALSGVNIGVLNIPLAWRTFKNNFAESAYLGQDLYLAMNCPAQK